MYKSPKNIPLGADSLKENKFVRNPSTQECFQIVGKLLLIYVVPPRDQCHRNKVVPMVILALCGYKLASPKIAVV